MIIEKKKRINLNVKEVNLFKTISKS